MLGHEDNQSYQRVSSVWFLYLIVGNPLQWNLQVGPQRIYLKIRRTRQWGECASKSEVAWRPSKNMTQYRMQLADFVLSILPEKYTHKKKTANQITYFATRIRPINNLIWNIMRGHYNKKGKKKHKVIEGVSTFCHLQGLNDQEAINVLTQVFKGVITADQMRLKIQKLKQEQRCFSAAIQYIQNNLEMHNVSFW